MPEPARESFASHLECAGTGARLPADRLQGLSPAGHPLLVRYDLERARASLTAAALAGRAGGHVALARDPAGRDAADIVSLGETRNAAGPARRGPPPRPGALLVKDEGRLPTGSFKARGIAVAVAMAKRFGVTRIAMPTNGNAGAALAAYGARAGHRDHLFCPADTPAVNLGEMSVARRAVHLVDGLIDDCGALVARRRGARAAGSTCRR